MLRLSALLQEEFGPNIFHRWLLITSTLGFCDMMIVIQVLSFSASDSPRHALRRCRGRCGSNVAVSPIMPYARGEQITVISKLPLNGGIAA